MANGVLIIGPSGSGKSTAARNLDPKKTFIIAPDMKGLPFKGWKANYKTVYRDDGKIDLDKSNYVETDTPNVILAILQYISKSRTDIEVVIIDTLNHIMTGEFMKKAKVSGFTKFTDLALDIFNICKLIPAMRPEMTVIVTGHNEVSFDADGGKVNKLRTIGKLLDEKIDIPSLFTTVLWTSVQPKDESIPYGFLTQTDGSNVAKSPMGMFVGNRIPNDYAYVLQKIKEYEN